MLGATGLEASFERLAIDVSPLTLPADILRAVIAADVAALPARDVWAQRQRRRELALVSHTWREAAETSSPGVVMLRGLAEARDFDATVLCAPEWATVVTQMAVQVCKCAPGDRTTWVCRVTLADVLEEFLNCIAACANLRDFHFTLEAEPWRPPPYAGEPDPGALDGGALAAGLLALPWLANLRTLHLDAAVILDVGLPHLLASCTSLRDVTLRRIRFYDDPRIWNRSFEGLAPPPLTRLDYTELPAAYLDWILGGTRAGQLEVVVGTQRWPERLGATRALAERVSALRVGIFDASSQPDFANLPRVMTHPHLESLVCEHFCLGSLESGLFSFAALVQLQELDLGAARPVSHADTRDTAPNLAKLARCLPRSLKVLRVRRTDYWTRDAIGALEGACATRSLALEWT